MAFKSCQNSHCGLRVHLYRVPRHTIRSKFYLQRGDTAMTVSRPGKRAQSSSSAIALIECSVKVSPTLARLIRKSAEKEMSGASAKDALLTAAGVQPGEAANLQRKLQQASEESQRWREKAAREHGQLEQSKVA